MASHSVHARQPSRSGEGVDAERLAGCRPRGRSAPLAASARLTAPLGCARARARLGRLPSLPWHVPWAGTPLSLRVGRFASRAGREIGVVRIAMRKTHQKRRNVFHPDP